MPQLLQKTCAKMTVKTKTTKEMREVHIMFKRISAIILLSAALLTSGVVGSADAASKQSTEPLYKVQAFYSINGEWQRFNLNEVNKLIQRLFSQWGQWEHKQEEQPKVEQPKVEQPKEEPKEDQPKVEQPKEEQPKVEQPKVEQPKQERPSTPQTPKEEPKQEQNQGYQLNQFEQQVIELTNNERAKHGLAPLKTDWELSRVAREKSRDLYANNYFDHNSPTYGSPFDMMRAYGISYRTAGENIAKGQRTPQEVVNAWMNSPGHRANILNGNFTHIGVGYIQQGNHWTQMFIGK